MPENNQDGSQIISVRLPHELIRRLDRYLDWSESSRPRPNTRVTSRHFDHLSGKRVVISSSKRPYGLTCSQISGVNALRSVSVNRPCQCG